MKSYMNDEKLYQRIIHISNNAYISKLVFTYYQSWYTNAWNYNYNFSYLYFNKKRSPYRNCFFIISLWIKTSKTSAKVQCSSFLFQLIYIQPFGVILENSIFLIDALLETSNFFNKFEVQCSLKMKIIYPFKNLPHCLYRRFVQAARWLYFGGV